MTNFEAAEITEQVLTVLGNKLESEFGQRPERELTLQLAKSFGYVKGRQGRGGGTFVQEAGLAFLSSQSVPDDLEEIELPADDNDDLEETALPEDNSDDSVPF